MRLQFYGCQDSRFSAFNICFQSVDLVIETLSVWERVYSRFINIQSTTQALGWAWLMSGFGSKEIKFDKLLPINIDNTNLSISEGYNQPTEETIQVLSRLLKTNRVPNKVMLSLVSTGILKNV